MKAPIPCLRPGFLRQTHPSVAAASTYLGFYNAFSAQVQRTRRATSRHISSAAVAIPEDTPIVTDVRIRTGTSQKNEKQILRREREDLWPRLPKQENILALKAFRLSYAGLKRGEIGDGGSVTVRGRIWSIRKSGAKLVFLDIMQDGVQIQSMFNLRNLESGELRTPKFQAFMNDLRRGDVISVEGLPHRTTSNELSVLAFSLPILLSRCRKSLPESVKNPETKMRNRHVDLLIDRRPAQILRLRSEILKFMREFLSGRGFVDVQTPILADAAGGAIARPFHTTSIEFEDRHLALRIAPELWLKRLIIGGFEKVYEIGPSFRNEGIDLSHNPEFWTCEFYKTYADLDDLIDMTEKIVSRMARVVSDLRDSEFKDLEGCNTAFLAPFHRIDFIPAIEHIIERPLPNLASGEAEAQLVKLLGDYQISLPSSPTLPRLLDRLSAEYLEPQCEPATWIINYPECLSPLSKSFIHPTNGQRVAARAELFVNKQEVVNTYEEENSPVEQRRKFEMQLQFKDAGDPSESIDEDYLQALEWGMPPTGGWGCGIDRLCMLFAGTNRIADTLSFGTLRNVVGRSRKNPLKP